MKDDKEQAHDAEREAAKKRMAESGRRNITQFNASRGGKPALTHGLHTVIASGGAEVPNIPGAQEAVAKVDALLSEVISDLGGAAQITGGRRAVLASQRLALLVLELGSHYLATHGLLDERGRPHPLLHVLNSYGNTVRLNATTLGLDRVPKVIDATLEEVMAEHGSDA
jgi:hypothetical protein